MSGACLHIDAPPQFDFRATVFSHGWYMLAPFAWDEASGSLGYTWRSPTDDLLQLHMSAVEGGVRVTCREREQLCARLRAAIIAVVRKMLSLDWDLRRILHRHASVSRLRVARSAAPRTHPRRRQPLGRPGQGASDHQLQLGAKPSR